jgi:hypothetical protein
MEFLKEMSLSLMGHGDIPFRKAVSYCSIGSLRSSRVAISNPATFPL